MLTAQSSLPDLPIRCTEPDMAEHQAIGPEQIARMSDVLLVGDLFGLRRR